MLGSILETARALRKLMHASGRHLLCRGCLGPLGPGAEAGLCAVCWSGLVLLPEWRCPRCALPHAEETTCPDPVGWSCGDALWNYRGGRPPLGALLLPGIKAGELGWRQAILGRAAGAPLPVFASAVELVTVVPTAFHRHWWRGFDLAEDFATQAAARLSRPFLRTLRKDWRIRRQAGQTASDRRRLPRTAVSLCQEAAIRNRRVLLVDDVWTTGTSLLRCAQALKEGGASEVSVLTLFRAL
jgi:predicted amidophosphoribosyltransferase